MRMAERSSFILYVLLTILAGRANAQSGDGFLVKTHTIRLVIIAAARDYNLSSIDIRQAYFSWG